MSHHFSNSGPLLERAKSKENGAASRGGGKGRRLAEWTFSLFAPQVVSLKARTDWGRAFGGSFSNDASGLQAELQT